MNSDKAPEVPDLFELIAVEPVDVGGADELLRGDLMSPFVWRMASGRLGVLLRSVSRPWKVGNITGEIWYGTCSDDGLHFDMDREPLLKPGPGPLDIGGCEDPTVVPTGEECIVYYTGLDCHGDGQMLRAAGPDIRSLRKRGVALASSKTERNTKEAAVVRTSDGQWRLFYEYSRDCRSRVGVAVSEVPDGPWQECDDPFAAREECWDSWHLSTGPLVMNGPDAPVMFYNGADRDAIWGVGWVLFDRACTRVLARSHRPLIAPPEHPVDGRDISFAASAIETEQEIWLYLSRNDCRVFRARVCRKA